jgi:hypothetical protein
MFYNMYRSDSRKKKFGMAVVDKNKAVVPVDEKAEDARKKLRTYSYLAASSYYKSEGARTHITTELIGYTLDTKNSNLDWAVYHSATEGVIVSFRGTDPTNVKDLGNDVLIGLGLLPHAPRFKAGVALVEKLKKQYPGKPMSLTGHSLGGALAYEIGQVTQIPSMSFNRGAGLGESTLLTNLAKKLAVSWATGGGLGVPETFQAKLAWLSGVGTMYGSEGKNAKGTVMYTTNGASMTRFDPISILGYMFQPADAKLHVVPMRSDTWSAHSMTNFLDQESNLVFEEMDKMDKFAEEEPEEFKKIMNAPTPSPSTNQKFMSYLGNTSPDKMPAADVKKYENKRALFAAIKKGEFDVLFKPGQLGQQDSIFDLISASQPDIVFDKASTRRLKGTISTRELNKYKKSDIVTDAQKQVALSAAKGQKATEKKRKATELAVRKSQEIEKWKKKINEMTHDDDDDPDVAPIDDDLDVVPIPGQEGSWKNVLRDLITGNHGWSGASQATIKSNLEEWENFNRVGGSPGEEDFTKYLGGSEEFNPDEFDDDDKVGISFTEHLTNFMWGRSGPNALLRREKQEEEKKLKQQEDDDDPYDDSYDDNYYDDYYDDDVDKEGQGDGQRTYTTPRQPKQPPEGVPQQQWAQGEQMPGQGPQRETLSAAHAATQVGRSEEYGDYTLNNAQQAHTGKPTLRPQWGSAGVKDVIPSGKQQLRSDLEFDMFSVVGAGFGEGRDNKLFNQQQQRDKYILPLGKQYKPNAWDGPMNTQHPIPWQWQSVKDMNHVKRYIDRTVAESHHAMMTAIKFGEGSAAGYGRDVPEEPMHVSSSGLPRDIRSPFEPVIHNSDPMTPVLDPAGYLLQRTRGLKRPYSAWREPQKLETYRDNYGPHLNKRRSLEVVLP